MSINASQPVLTGPVQNSALRDRDAFLGLVGVALVLFALSLPLALPGSGLSRTGFAVAVFAFALVLTRLSLPKDELCLLYTSPSPRDATLSRMPSSA